MGVIGLIYELLGRPVPLARHRHRGRYCYDPQKDIKGLFRARFKGTYGSVVAIDKPMKLTLVYHMNIPKSSSRKRASELLNSVHHIKPDLSNLIKFTEDAFNGVMWLDDSLICEIQATKIWSTIGKTVIVIAGV